MLEIMDDPVESGGMLGTFFLTIILCFVFDKVVNPEGY